MKMKPSVEWLPTTEQQMHKTCAINGTGGFEPTVGVPDCFQSSPTVTDYPLDITQVPCSTF